MLALIDAWPIGGFVTGMLLAWLNHAMVARRERKTGLKDARFEVYERTVTQLVELYRMALRADSIDVEPADHFSKLMDALARLSIFGSERVMDAYGIYAEYVNKCLAEQHAADEPRLRRLLTEVTYAMCCDIHGERYRRAEPREAVDSR